MRLLHPNGEVLHLSYGSNVHPAESVEGIIDQLRRFGGGVRARLGVDRLGIGLWLPASVAAELAGSPAALERVRTVLARHRLEVVTLNAFPYRGFHDPVVKRAVYRPDWSEPSRLQYTLDCAKVLGALLPDDAARGSISSLPLGWRSPWYADRDASAREALHRLDEQLGKLSADLGRPVRVGLEPEPGCVVETAADAAERWGSESFDLVGVCLDACHLATGFEEGAEAFDRVTDAGLSVVKLQASAALHAESPTRDRDALAAWTEDRFLHQTREQRGKRVDGRDDLGDALDGTRPLPGNSPWRVHFHVPVHADPTAPLASTRDHLAATLAALVAGPAPVTDHVEVETYTWGVLPESMRPVDEGGLVAGIAAEVAWVRDVLISNGMREVTS